MKPNHLESGFDVSVHLKLEIFVIVYKDFQCCVRVDNRDLLVEYALDLGRCAIDYFVLF